MNKVELILKSELPEKVQKFIEFRGEIFSIDGEGYVLAETKFNVFQLICLNDGTRYSKDILIDRSTLIKREHLVMEIVANCEELDADDECAINHIGKCEINIKQL